MPGGSRYRDGVGVTQKWNEGEAAKYYSKADRVTLNAAAELFDLGSFHLEFLEILVGVMKIKERLQDELIDGGELVEPVTRRMSR